MMVNARPLQRLNAHGLSVSLLPGWDIRITLREQSEILVPGDEVPVSGFVHPVLHAATVAMPPLKGDYGSHVLPLLGLTDVFIAIAEFDAEAGNTPLFRPGFPKLRASEFDQAALQRALPNRCGTQRFFTVEGRAFSLFCVLGSSVRRNSLSALATKLLQTVVVEPQ